MGNGSVTGKNKEQQQEQQQQKKIVRSKSTQLGDLFNRRKSAASLVFYACTDKAQVITEILEERGWSRTKDTDVTNFTIKWCLEHQVNWNKFQEGKQLINNIPGQITFADKVNLWYTIRDFLESRKTITGNIVQTFLPMTFILDDENDLNEFLRIYKKQNRIWICKPRYSYAGQGIHVFSGNSNMESILKVQSNAGKRTQHQPKSPGYLTQEYISRPLLIKGRKFDMRVHWLVAWTKPLTVFYNHNASVVRLSLNLYREFDFDRATHLTNLSVQEHHYRYASSQEETGMTMQQLNAYFNKCFRPFHPQLCEDWVMTVMQERMHTIIRQVVRASKHKLERIAGHFGLFGCDFLLDESFRLWLLEVNDNPGVGWGNTQVNTTTKPLFEETLNIVFECFDNYKNKRPVLPVQCLKNYKLIYNENDDAASILNDDIQVFNERATVRPTIKDLRPRTPLTKTLPQINANRSSTAATSTDLVVNSENTPPSTNEPILSRSIDWTAIRREMIRREAMKPESAQERLMKLRAVRKKYTFQSQIRSRDKLNQLTFKRSPTSINTYRSMQQKRSIDLKPIVTDKKRSKQQDSLTSSCSEIADKENTMIVKEAE
ncbi:unnamed protein product [Adineta steineri]|uniref:ATP-grasp domain-containing protein n=1 Tax=Adineta steineri TaxID=433720 RepID=A0A818FZT3_9BILA|nr:unnamed protein product [Adineta steineri]